MTSNRKISAEEAVQMVAEENPNELNHVHDLRNLLDFTKLDGYQNHVPPEEYAKSGGEVGQILFSTLKIIPHHLVEQFDTYLTTDTDQVHNENH